MFPGNRTETKYLASNDNLTGHIASVIGKGSSKRQLKVLTEKDEANLEVTEATLW